MFKNAVNKQTKHVSLAISITVNSQWGTPHSAKHKRAIHL